MNYDTLVGVVIGFGCTFLVLVVALFVAARYVKKEDEVRITGTLTTKSFLEAQKCTPKAFLEEIKPEEPKRKRKKKEVKIDGNI